MGSNHRQFQDVPRPCDICTVRVDAKDETVHFQKFHAANTERKGEITWITPHHAVYGGRHYKPMEIQR